MASHSTSPVSGTSIPFGSPTTFTITFIGEYYEAGEFSTEAALCTGMGGNGTELGGFSVAMTGSVRTLTVTPSALTQTISGTPTCVRIRAVFPFDNHSGTGFGTYVSEDIYPLIMTTACGAPTACALSATLAREAVTLSWSGATDGEGNTITGYDIQRRESSDGVSWGSWADEPGSPVTGTGISVSPPDTVGSYAQFRVRTRGSAGSDYYSDWVTSENLLRRKWDAFGAWTDSTLTAGVSVIRAVHLTQLQERVNAIRTFLGMSACSFAAIKPGVTKIAQWAAHIREIRDAIDEITADHEAWQAMEAGKPRAAQITQMRSIVDNL